MSVGRAIASPSPDPVSPITARGAGEGIKTESQSYQPSVQSMITQALARTHGCAARVRGSRGLLCYAPLSGRGPSANSVDDSTSSDGAAASLGAALLIGAASLADGFWPGACLHRAADGSLCCLNIMYMPSFTQCQCTRGEMRACTMGTPLSHSHSPRHATRLVCILLQWKGP